MNLIPQSHFLKKLGMAGTTVGSSSAVFVNYRRVSSTRYEHAAGHLENTGMAWREYDASGNMTNTYTEMSRYSEIRLKDDKPATIDFLGAKVKVVRIIRVPIGYQPPPSSVPYVVVGEVKEDRPQERVLYKVTRKDAFTPRKSVVSVKSFIRRMATAQAVMDGKLDSDTDAALGFPELVGGRLSAFELLLATDLLFSEDPAGPMSEATDYRLWSEVEIASTCNAGTLASYSVGDVQTSFGKEGSLPAAGALVAPRKVTANPAGKSITISYMVKGRPNVLALPSFEHVKPRSCSWIWHDVTIDLSCDGDRPKVDVMIAGSHFPSHRAWVDGSRKVDIPQGPFDRLWRCSVADSTLIE